MSRFKPFVGVFNDFISLLFPRVCQACGSLLVRGEEVICLNCLSDMPFTTYHTDRDNPLEKEFWGRCEIEKAAAMCYYRRGSRMQHLIHRMKYYQNKRIGDFLGRMYGQKLKSSGFAEDADIIIPVPLHRTKLRKRGFNQSEIIAVGLSGILDIPVDTGLLERIGRSSTQTRKSRVERWENVDGIFSLTGELYNAGLHIILVDDVITTGSTIEACVNTLKRLDGARVTVVALATAVM